MGEDMLIWAVRQVNEVAVERLCKTEEESIHHAKLLNITGAILNLKFEAAQVKAIDVLIEVFNRLSR